MSTAACLAETCRLWLLIALLAAAGGKSIAFGRFREDLAASFPELGRAVAPVAAAIVATEGLLALLLLWGGAPGRFGLIAAATLFALLTAVVAVTLAQDRTVVCSCFGGASHRMSGYDLWRNGLLVAAAVFAAAVPRLDGIDLLAQVALFALASMLFQLSAGLQDIAVLLRIKA